MLWPFAKIVCSLVPVLDPVSEYKVRTFYPCSSTMPKFRDRCKWKFVGQSAQHCECSLIHNNFINKRTLKLSSLGDLCLHRQLVGEIGSYLLWTKVSHDPGFGLNFLFHWPAGPVIPAHQWSTEDFADPKLRSLLGENISVAPANVQQITQALWLTSAKVFSLIIFTGHLVYPLRH